MKENLLYVVYSDLRTLQRLAGYDDQFEKNTGDFFQT